MKTLIFLAIVSVTCSGCGVALLTAAAGYTVSAIGEKNTAKDAAYADYALKMRQLNMERESRHLAPEPIMSSQEWASSK